MKDQVWCGSCNSYKKIEVCRKRGRRWQCDTCAALVKKTAAASESNRLYRARKVAESYRKGAMPFGETPE